MLLLLIVRSSSLGRLPGSLHAYPYIGERCVSSTGCGGGGGWFAIPDKGSFIDHLFRQVVS